jgi:hypothetical protein
MAFIAAGVARVEMMLPRRVRRSRLRLPPRATSGARIPPEGWQATRLAGRWRLHTVGETSTVEHAARRRRHRTPDIVVASQT